MTSRRRLAAILTLASTSVLAGVGCASGPTNQEQCSRYTRLLALSEAEGEPDFGYAFNKGKFCTAARRDRQEAVVDGSD